MTNAMDAILMVLLVTNRKIGFVIYEREATTRT